MAGGEDLRDQLHHPCRQVAPGLGPVALKGKWGRAEPPNLSGLPRLGAGRRDSLCRGGSSGQQRPQKQRTMGLDRGRHMSQGGKG